MIVWSIVINLLIDATTYLLIKRNEFKKDAKWA